MCFHFFSFRFFFKMRNLSLRKDVSSSWDPTTNFCIHHFRFLIFEKKVTNHIVSVCIVAYLHSCQNNLIDWKIREYFVLFFRENLWWTVHSNTNPERYMKISLTSIKVKIKVCLTFCGKKRQQYKIPWVYQNNMLRHWIFFRESEMEFCCFEVIIKVLGHWVCILGQ